MGINLKSFVFPPARPDYSAVDILRKAKADQSKKDFLNKTNKVTTGFVSISYSDTPGIWSVSDLIEFPYSYTEKPLFTWGLEGTYSGDTSNATPYVDIGGNNYTKLLPLPLQTYANNDDYTSFSPAIFVPRVIHWYKKTAVTWNGCYILVFQLNPDCTEINSKVLRLHFKFEGLGYIA